MLSCDDIGFVVKSDYLVKILSYDSYLNKIYNFIMICNIWQNLVENSLLLKDFGYPTAQQGNFSF